MQIGWKRHDCANDGSTTSITYLGTNGDGWNGYYTPWQDGDGVGVTFEGSSPDTSLLGIFSVYEKGIEIPSYSSVDVEWEYQLRSKSTKHHSATCLYFLEGAQYDITHLEVDFSNHHDTETGAEYLLDSLVNRAQDGNTKTGSEKTIHFGFDNRLGSTDQDKTWYLLLTHVVGSAEGKTDLYEWGSFKSVSVKTTQTYYKIFTFDANAEDATGTMEQSVVAGVGKLPRNKFAREGYHVKDISHAIQAYVESQGFSIVREYVGHSDERTTLHNYCFDRNNDEQRLAMVEKAVTVAH